MIDSFEFLDLLKEEKKSVFRLGTIVSGKVKFDGEETASQKNYKRLGSYTLTNGDRVLLVRIAGTYIILGKVI